jgi:hypothetical protein
MAPMQGLPERQVPAAGRFSRGDEAMTHAASAGRSRFLPATFLPALGALLCGGAVASALAAPASAGPTAQESPAPAAAGVEASAAIPVDKSDWESGWHVVRPGDTLEGLAARFLGSTDHWRELHLLNPTVKDPDLLYPGQRLRIFLERPTAKLSAQVMAVARDVHELPTPVPWRPASEGDVLLERDALRTAKSASARLRFDDGATVTLSEDSLVFIRRQSVDSAPVAKKEIEIQLGQVDVMGATTETARPAPAGGTSATVGNRRGGSEAIEVVVAGARSVATPEDGQPLSTRSRRGTDNLAQFMVFAGKSTVSAAGASVEVPAGTGTSVAPKAKPGPVEALLPAPTDARPAYGEEIEQAAPRFAWNPVSGAAHYKVEVCRDPACGAVVALSSAIAADSLQLDVAGGLPEGELFWRVTAVAPSGLDGFPTAPIRVLAVESVRPATPILALRSRAGASVPAGACVTALPDPIVHAVDRRGTELPWVLLLDGREAPLDGLHSLSLAGSHSLAARVTDGRGRTADSTAVAFTVDAAAPWVDLVATSPEKSSAAAGPGEESRGRSRKRAKKEPEPVPACDTGLEFLAAGGAWTPVPCAVGAAPVAAVARVESSNPVVQLRATGNAIAFGENVVSAGGTLSLSAWDVGCGVTQMSLRIAPSPYRSGKMLLESAVSDGAGNTRTQAWHLARYSLPQ